MMHVLCEEYETVYAACLLITSAVLGVDFGYQPTDKGELEYIIQIEPELLDRLKAGEAIQMGLPPNMQKVQVFRVQVGTAELPKVLPTAYAEEAKEKKPELGLTPTDVPALTSPPEQPAPTNQADNRPALNADDELAQYTPRSARQLPAGANEPAGSGYSAGTSGTGSAIPGAEQRYGGTSNFSVPDSRYGATQTGGTTPIASAPNSNLGNTAAQTPTAGANTATNTNTANSGASIPSGGSTATDNYNRWGPSNNLPAATNTSSTTNPTGSQAGASTPNATANNNSGTGTNSDPYRFNLGNTNSSNTQAAPDLITPSDWTSTSGQNGSTANNQNGQNVNPNNGSSQNGVNPNNSNTPPAGQNGGNFYDPRNPPYASGGQQQNGTFNPLWPNDALNGNNGNQAPYSPMPNPNYNNGQYPPQQNPNYNPNPGNYAGNTYGQQPPAGYNPQAPYGYNSVTGQPLPAPYPGAPVGYFAALPNQQQAPPQQAPSTPPPSNNNGSNGDSSNNSADNQEVSKSTDRDFLPSWWPLLAFGFLVSCCANGYMWMISQDFQRKYQDLLEDVRDLRTLSDN